MYRLKSNHIKIKKSVMAGCLALLLVLTGAPAGEAYAANEKFAITTLKDGIYQIGITLEGGSGRATVTSPAQMEITESKAVVRIEWSSSSYDYMKLEGETFYPVNTEGNSVFLLPVKALDEKLEVIADTTAMSVPYEISYKIFLDSSTIQGAEKDGQKVVIVCIAAGVILIFAGVLFIKRKRKNK